MWASSLACLQPRPSSSTPPCPQCAPCLPSYNGHTLKLWANISPSPLSCFLSGVWAQQREKWVTSLNSFSSCNLSNKSWWQTSTLLLWPCEEESKGWDKSSGTKPPRASFWQHTPGLTMSGKLSWMARHESSVGAIQALAGEMSLPSSDLLIGMEFCFAPFTFSGTE